MKFKIMLLASFLVAAAGFAHAQNLYTKYNGGAVKIFISEIKNSTQEADVNTQTLKTEIEKALKERKSITFRFVSTAEEAEIVIDATVNEFMWTDHDPVDMLVGVAGTAADVAMVEDYARLQADVTVTDNKSKKTVWRERVLATITKKPMTKSESFPLVAENFAKSFIKSCFSKKSK
jgi:hypothetical protein